MSYPLPESVLGSSRQFSAACPLPTAENPIGFGGSSRQRFTCRQPKTAGRPNPARRLAGAGQMKRLDTAF
jgi:hypothetical protein